MTDEERMALEAVQFNWAVAPDDVWSPVTHHVDGLHERVAKSVLDSVSAARASQGASPIGVVLQGDRGVGKTHLLRWVRQQVQESDGYFFLVKLLEGHEFWRSAVHGIVDGFFAGQVDQLTPLLRRLAALAGMSPLAQTRIAGMLPLFREDLDALVIGIGSVDRQVWMECQNTLRALVLYRAVHPELQEIGYGYLTLDGDVEESARLEWGFRRGTRSRQLVLRDLSRLLALTGPTVIAVDQIDGLINQSDEATTDAASVTAKRSALVGEIADGLMELREVTRRTLSILACIPASWETIRSSAVISAADRFRVSMLQGAMPDSDVARAIVAQHLGGWYAEVGFTPPYDTWPVRPSAFESASARTFTPRRLLQRVDAHIRKCLDSGELIELDDLADEPAPVGPPQPPDPRELQAMDAWFTRLRDEADVGTPLRQDSEDDWMPPLLTAGLSAYIAELGEAGQHLAVDQVRGRKPALHARLRRTLDERTEDEVHVAFRGIAHSHARAVQSRISAASTEAGLRAGGDKRTLVLIRNSAWPSGPVTARVVAELEEQGGVVVPISEDDLRTFAALEVMQRPQKPGFLEWLAARRPAGSTELFRRTLGDVAPPQVAASPSEDADAAPVAEPALPPPADDPPPAGNLEPTAERPEPPPRWRPSPVPRPRVPTVPVGRSDTHQRDVHVPLESLRKHTVVFAGSGSGKTVLLRRLVEECALHGVSAIVLDPNNDLARLGDAWPEPPQNWHDGDAEKAATYLDQTEVVVWTPGRSKGRPLAFQPLPDFGAVLGDDDEFAIAVGAAVASLAPRAQLTGRKVESGRAVLREVLTYYAGHGASSLDGFIDLLGDLPEGISGLRNGQKLAAEMAEALTAAMINDPLFGGSGETADPSVLLTPSEGNKARISVISFIGLPADEQRQSFVNQLQMALFSWVKANPAGDRPLGGLFVLDEAQTFAPSGAMTACTESTISLASQARKYGLGLVFATQAPKGLHNRIPGNAATQFFGYLNSGTQINAATELARAKGGQVSDISRLSSGQFYVASEGLAFERVHEPMCLSHHPPSPLTSEEVIKRAVEGRA
ncbi:ATP-binding protein [Pseudonocardia sp. CA-142604]|uniref:ATP-binding protein n=1 Tax=Pseudonocardia sp. CA-142604 TaxID=3240024 RepID=UPI003D92095A